jgi:hypothetical protein
MYTFQVLKKITNQPKAFNIDQKGINRIHAYIKVNNLKIKITQTKINDRQFILVRK